MSASPLASPAPWDLVAPAYTDFTAGLLETFSARALELVAPAPGSRIVDVACGPGTLSMLAARRGISVDALDFSPNMIASLESRKAREPDGSRITPRIGDGQALPYDDATFDGGFSMFGLMFFPDRAKGLAELRRVLKPGAKAAISSWPQLDEIPIFGAIFGTIHRLVMPDAPRPQAVLSTEAQCRAEMSAAFSDIEVISHDTRQSYESPRELWDVVQRTTAPIAFLKSKVADKWQPISDAVIAAITQISGEGPGTLPISGWITVGTAR